GGLFFSRSEAKSQQIYQLPVVTENRPPCRVERASPSSVTAADGSGSIFPMTDHPLNTKGLQCPLPVLRARKAIKAIAIGDTLTVEATDPGARKDFPAFCEATSNRLLSVTEEDGILRFVIERTT
ncbi:sulfurtransferase TusA family protein, partial [Azospirillum sp. B506]|uniref:sulfurtransferase TusA family protein n=1 Tax=Azospirillum sp. B506 TaxID=137721 RepID=UPI0027D8A479